MPDEEALGNLPIRSPCDEQVQHVLLTSSQRLDSWHPTRLTGRLCRIWDRNGLCKSNDVGQTPRLSRSAQLGEAVLTEYRLGHRNGAVQTGGRRWKGSGANGTTQRIDRTDDRRCVFSLTVSTGKLT